MLTYLRQPYYSGEYSAWYCVIWRWYPLLINKPWMVVHPIELWLNPIRRWFISFYVTCQWTAANLNSSWIQRHLVFSELRKPKQRWFICCNRRKPAEYGWFRVRKLRMKEPLKAILARHLKDRMNSNGFCWTLKTCNTRIIKCLEPFCK
jgi:hypothetical protein